jgi:glycerol-3-phosphate dehydrogenase
MKTREQMWDSLGGQVDLLVVGGGVTGSGIARDAARRGLSVALVEMEDLAYGTSSRSSKLVHGGLRYLEHYEFSLVFEAVSERRILLDIAPHLVNPLGFLFPVYKGSRHNLFVVNTGMWLYDGLSLFRSPRIHQKLGAKQVAEKEPTLKQEGLKGAPLYWDCSTDDARLTLETALDAAKAGAIIATRAKVNSFVKDNDGRVGGVVVENTLTGELKEVRAHAVVNATGPWTDKTIAMSKPLGGGRLLRPTKGVHIVVKRSVLPVENAVVLFHPEDERVLFALPWGDHTYIGTTDTDYDADPADVAATSEDVDYLIGASGHYFPDNLIQRSDVVSTWAGLRPLMKPVNEGGDVDESAVSREHQIVVGQDGLITIAGGKLTTYRRMAAEVVDTAVKLLRLQNRLPDGLSASDTDREPLPGAIGWPADDDHDAVAEVIRKASKNRLDSVTSRHLGDTYGMRGVDLAKRVAADETLGTKLIAGLPDILVQVDWAVEEELAATVTDVLHRRTQIIYRAPDQGLECAEAVAKRMAGLLDWDEERTLKEIADYADDVGLSRQWQTPEEQKGAFIS